MFGNRKVDGSGDGPFRTPSPPPVPMEPSRWSKYRAFLKGYTTQILVVLLAFSVFRVLYVEISAEHNAQRKETRLECMDMCVRFDSEYFSSTRHYCTCVSPTGPKCYIVDRGWKPCR